MSLEEDTLCAPRIVKKLPEVVQTKEGDLTKLEVQVFGKPKPKTKWLHEDKEIRPTETYDIQNFPDGTSVLLIHDVKPENIGKITFEAHNTAGVAETTTELVTEGILKFQIFLFFQTIFAGIFRILQRFAGVSTAVIPFNIPYLSEYFPHNTFEHILSRNISLLLLILLNLFIPFQFQQKFWVLKNTGNRNGLLIWRKCRKLFGVC